MTTQAISTLADVDQLPLSAECEPYETGGGLWVIVKCPKCKLNSPFFVEKPYVPDFDA